MSNPNSKAPAPPSSNAVKGGTGIYVPSFPLQFKLNSPNVTSNVVQTLSTLTSEVATTKKKLQGTEVLASKALSVANKETNGVPQALWSLDVTQTAQIKASYTNDFISCSFTYNTKDPNFGFVRIYVTGLNGGTEPVEVASGSVSPITFDMDATGQTVTITAQVVSSGGVSQPFADAVTAQLTLNGFSSAMGGQVAGYGPLGWTPVYILPQTTVNIGTYGYSGMVPFTAPVNSTYFYVRLWGYLVPSTTGTYTLGLNSDDGANLYICGQQVGTDNLATSRAMSANLTYSAGSSATVLLNAGTYYPIVIEWQQQLGSYGLQLLWTPPNGSAQVIPTGNLSASPTSITSSLNQNIWNGTTGLWFPAGNGFIDPANKVLFGPPANGGGSNVVNAVSAVTSSVAGGSFAQGPNTFTAPGWIVGQAYSLGGTIDIALNNPSSPSNTGYMFQINYINASQPGIIYLANSFIGFSYTGIGTYYGAVNPRTMGGWVNFAIYIGAKGYMALWLNGNLVTDVTDLTYPSPSNTIFYGYQSSAGKIAPAPNGSGAGSTALNPQGSIATISDYTFSYASTTTTIKWSWSAFSIYCPDGTTYSVAASTGSTIIATASVVTGTGPLEYTGLTASTTYYFSPFVTLNANGTGTVSILGTGTIQTLAQLVQIVNADGNVACATNVTAATTASGSGGGSGGGGGTTCFSPNTKVKTQRGDIAISDIIAGVDEVLTARGTWRIVDLVTTTPLIGPMLNMGNGELSTPTHLVRAEGAWIPMETLGAPFPVVPYDGTIHNLHIETEADDDGSRPDTEHSYTLANGLVVHNIITNIP